MIPAYSPQARGRSERNFGTWQGRLPQELRLRGIRPVEEANRFLREHYMAAFNQRFRVSAAQRCTAFTRYTGRSHSIHGILPLGIGWFQFGSGGAKPTAPDGRIRALSALCLLDYHCFSWS
jgi:hypothetical protein